MKLKYQNFLSILHGGAVILLTCGVGALMVGKANEAILYASIISMHSQGDGTAWCHQQRL